jgi:hypothetical protein
MIINNPLRIYNILNGVNSVFPSIEQFKKEFKNLFSVNLNQEENELKRLGYSILITMVDSDNELSKKKKTKKDKKNNYSFDFFEFKDKVRRAVDVNNKILDNFISKNIKNERKKGIIQDKLTYFIIVLTKDKIESLIKPNG